MAKTDVLKFSKEKQGYSCEFISVGKCAIQIDREKKWDAYYIRKDRRNGVCTIVPILFHSI